MLPLRTCFRIQNVYIPNDKEEYGEKMCAHEIIINIFILDKF